MASRDYEEFLEGFNARGVKYLIVGAHAVAHHARPRATKDLDLWIEPTQGNARKVLVALREFFGGAELGYGVKDVTDPNTIVQLGVAPTRIDLMADLTGVSEFASAWSRRARGVFGPVPTQYLGLDDLIRAKRAVDREQDRADVTILERAKRSKPRGR